MLLIILQLALVSVYIDLVSPKSPSLQTIGFFAKRHLQFFVYVTFVIGTGHKKLDGFISLGKCLCCLGMIQHEQDLMQLRFQYQENC